MADLATDQTITYNAIPTDIGLTKIQLAMTTGEDLILSTLAYGDGGGSTPIPKPDQTSLVNQIGSTEILGHEEDLEDNVTWFSGVIQAGDALGVVRELGLFDVDGNLCFVGNIPDIVLPEAAEGVAINLPIQLGIKNYYSKYISIKTHIRVTEQIEGSGGYSLFDVVQKDHILTYEESEGFGLQGTYVYPTGLDQDHYGYPDFIKQCLKEKNDPTTIVKRITLGSEIITGYVSTNGHIYYDVASDKAAVDAYFEQYGVAWFYGIEENYKEDEDRVFLPRNNYFFKNAFMEPNTFRPNYTQDFDPGKHNLATLPSLLHTHTVSEEAAGSHTHVTSMSIAGSHKHNISTKSTVLDFSHTHGGGTLKVTILGTGILSSTRLTNLVKQGNINARYVSKGVTYRQYFNNFYSGAIYMDPAVTGFSTGSGEKFDDTFMGGTNPTGGLLTKESASFPDVDDDSQGYNGGLVRFNSARANQTWSGSTSSESPSLKSKSHNHAVEEATAGDHVHSITQDSAGSHIHNINIDSKEPVPNNILGDTVTPPSSNMLLYIVVGNVRRRSAMVIDQKLEEALEEIEQAANEAVERVEATVDPALETIETAVTEATQEIHDTAEQVEQNIQEKIDEAEEYATISREQAEISEYWAHVSIAGQVQADWDQTDPNQVDYIKNKPEVDWANLVYLTSEQTIINKNINANDNNITNIGWSNLASELIVTSLDEEVVTSNTLATSQAIYNAIKFIKIQFSNFDPQIILTELNQDNVSNTSLATTAAIYRALTDATTAITSRTIVNMGVVDNIENSSVVSNQTVPTSLAVYRAILNSVGSVFKIEGAEGVQVETLRDTRVDVQSTDSDLVVVSFYSGTQDTPGVLNYIFTYIGSTTELDSQSTATSSNPDLELTCNYNQPESEIGTVERVFTYSSEQEAWLNEDDNIIDLSNYNITIDSGTPQNNDTITLTTVTIAIVVPPHWEMGGETVQLVDYYLNIESGTPKEGDQISLTYTTTSTTIISADLEEIASLVDYNTLKNRPNYIFTEGLKSESKLNTETTIKCSNENLEITSTYIPEVEGEISYSFDYKEGEDPSTTGWYDSDGVLVNLTDYDITVVGTPHDLDSFTITYTSTKYTYISNNVEYTDGLSYVADLQTIVEITSSNEDLQIVSSYSGTEAQEGTITYIFEYTSSESHLVTTEQIECTNPDLIITSTYSGTESDVGTKVYRFVYEKNTSLNTTTQVQCSNPNVEVVSTYSGTQGEAGVLTYSFTYRDYIWSGETLYGWFLNDSSLVDDMSLQYNLTITGQPEIGDTIELEYTTIEQVDYLGWVYYDEFGSREEVDLASFDLSVSGEPQINDVITVTHVTTGTVDFYWIDSNTKERVNLDDYDLTVYGTPQVSDTITLVYITTMGRITVSLDAITQTPDISSTKVATTKYVRNLQAYQPLGTFSNGKITLQDDINVYSSLNDITTTTIFEFDSSNLSYLDNTVFYTFEVKFTMTAVASLQFPSNVIWEDNDIPALDKLGTYLLAFRTMDGGNTYVANLQGVW